jgi:hypothetical protein
LPLTFLFLSCWSFGVENEFHHPRNFILLLFKQQRTAAKETEREREEKRKYIKEIEKAGS